MGTCLNLSKLAKKSTMDAFLLLSDQHQSGNPNFSSSSFNCPSITNDDRVYDHTNVDNTLYYNHNLNDDNSNPNTLSLIDHQDSSSSNSLSYLNTTEQTPDFLEITTDVHICKSPRISADAASMTQLTWIERQLLYDDNSNRERLNDDTKIGFRIQTALEVLDDGYRWRKYGKKKIKCTPNPRNYFKCSTMGCKVKKRVELDRDDSSYVIATYIGLHNHDVPSTTASSSKTCPTGVWTLQYS
ncbi:DNA-binding WRKY [Artemisia annua]|uniref:DNA-binding WRKY n=1 Tax=Artemisia annua TaxID=35608 RepID=A0A2U1N1D6_ARTAN|nr:DNA-binding WRKY [Artemisia annua]